MGLSSPRRHTQNKAPQEGIKAEGMNIPGGRGRGLEKGPSLHGEPQSWYPQPQHVGMAKPEVDTEKVPQIPQQQLH